MIECPDCGAPKEATLVFGFACEHVRCPMLGRDTVALSNDDALLRDAVMLLATRSPLTVGDLVAFAKKAQLMAKAEEPV